LRVADAPEKLNPAVVAGQRAELRLVFAGACDLERDIPRETLHRSNDEIRALPPVQTAWQKEVLAGPRRFEPGHGGRRMQDLVRNAAPEVVCVDQPAIVRMTDGEVPAHPPRMQRRLVQLMNQRALTLQVVGAVAEFAGEPVVEHA
jgi:hypothetical protein